MIPLFSVGRETYALKNEMLSAIEGVLDSSHFIGGKEVEKFEEEFARYCGSRFCVGISNGTEALVAALVALGVKYGDEVILPAFTFTATAEAVALCGAKPVFVDIHSDTDYNISIDALESALSKNTVAVIAVHLYGVPAEMEELRSFCKKNSLALIEDAAQAHGALYKNKKVGSLGDVACFSFYPTKNLGACGDAGALTTDSEEIARKVRLFINHGRKTHTEHIIVGTNARLDALQASLLRVKLPYLDEWCQKRSANWNYLKNALSEIKGLRIRTPSPILSPSWHIFVAETEKRDSLISYLKSNGVDAGVHYPLSLVELDAYNYLKPRKENFPESVSAAAKVFSLPVHPFLTDSELDKITDTVRGFFY
ncbi:MAG: DegT/DnrJ/EryC1/StrS family aminotransferase [Planctomycetota bacterium]|nr:DegT/DnrJ/EryC1/StrS family aminotransferase [Planctomycetota bacterium]